MTKRYFCMDLHISVIADFKSLGLDVEVVDWCMSGHAFVMNRPQDTPKHINAKTWQQLNPEMIAAFQKEYDTFLSGFDGFVVGYASSFAMVFEKYGKPIVLMNAVRFDMPFCWTGDMGMRAQYLECLQRLKREDRLIAVSNNKADREYMGRAGVDSHYIPSLCLYTKMKYNPIRPTFLFYTGSCQPDRRITQRHELGGNFAWQTVAEFKGTIHIPYDISTMSLFEQFSAGCPMFFPSKKFLLEKPENLITLSAYWGDRPIPAEYGDMSKTAAWIELADFYEAFQSPNTYYYDSFSGDGTSLSSLLDSFVYVDDTAERAASIVRHQATWKALVKL